MERRTKWTLVCIVLILGAGIVGAFTLIDAMDSQDDQLPLSVDEVSSELGLEYNYSAGDGTDWRKIQTNAGVYVSDTNRDGYPDILAIGGAEPTLFINTGDSYERSSQLAGVNVKGWPFSITIVMAASTSSWRMLGRETKSSQKLEHIDSTRTQ